MDQPGNTSTSNIVVPIVCRPDYRIGLEVIEGGALFIHADVYGKTTKHLLTRFRADIDTIMGLVNQPVFAMTYSTDPKTVAKLTKFAAKMGFTPHGVFDCLDGNPRLVHLRWDKAS